jgi:tetratricopeptide (TPR) repeat protein
MNVSQSTQWSFRPAQMPEDMFMKTFAGREKELDMIFNHINFNLIPSNLEGNKKNLMIKAERGMGKTSLFLAVKYKLKAERTGMLEKMIPIFFNEREDFNTAEKLIVRIFEIIAENKESVVRQSLTHLPEWKKGLKKIKGNARKCLDILKHNLELEEKKLVLFIENFDDMVYRVLRQKGKKKTSKSGSRELFAKLVMDPNIVMICSGLEDPVSPHDSGYDSFQVEELKPVGDFYDLIIKRARYDNNLFLLANKERLNNKIKAFEYLTGGNTRLMVHLYECLVEKDIDKLALLLNDMINKSTPLFEWILQKFLDFESREILNNLARRGGNATVKELAEDTFNSEESVRTLLNRLRKGKFVQKINEKRDRSDIYIMVPMILFIWYQKVMLQKKDVILDFFIHFVDLFFDPTELDRSTQFEQIYQKKEGDDAFSPYFVFIKKYLEAGKFPLKSTDEKREDDPENEQMIYELVRVRQDDTILQTQLHKALSLKSEKKLAEAANLFRIVARGYLELTEVVEGSLVDQAEENIRRAIEIYRNLKTIPLETVRCQLRLVEILSDTERKEELKLFAQTIIRIGKKEKGAEFNWYIGSAYKYLGFVETNVEKKLELFNTAMDYFEKDTEQTIIVLLNIGLTYQSKEQYESALTYFEKSLEESKRKNYFDQLNPIIYFILDVYRIVEDHRGGLVKINELIVWLEKEQTLGIDWSDLFYRKAFFLNQNAEFFEAEKCLLKSIESAREETNATKLIFRLISLISIYSGLNKQEAASKSFEEIKSIIDETPDLSNDVLNIISSEFFDLGYIDEAIALNEKLLKSYRTLENKTGEARTLQNNGICYRVKNNFPEAEKCFLKAIEVAKENDLEELLLKAKINYSTLLYFTGRTDEVIALLEGLSEEDTVNNDVKERLFFGYMQKAWEVFKLEDSDSAFALVKKAFNYINYLSFETFVDGFYFKLVIPLIEKFKKKIYPFLKQVELILSQYGKEKEDIDFNSTFGCVVKLMEGKPFDKVAKDLTPAERHPVELIDSILNKDEVLEKAEQLVESGETKQAIEVLEDSLKKEPVDAEKMEKLAGLYKSTSENKKYFEMLKKIVKLQPENREVLIPLAEYYLDVNEIDKAKDTLEKLISKNPNDAEILFLLGDFERQRKNYEKAIEYMKKSITYRNDNELKEASKIFLAELYLMDNSVQANQKAEDVLKTVEIDKFRNYKFSTVFRYNFLKIIVYMLRGNKSSLKHILTSTLYLSKDLPVRFEPKIKDPGLTNCLKGKKEIHNFEFLASIERVINNEIPISYFVRKFGDFIESKVVNDIHTSLQDASIAILKRIQVEKITDIKEVSIICGSRICHESLLYQIKEQFPGLADNRQEQLISLLTAVLVELPESYKWLVLDFCSEHFINISQIHQETLVNAMFNRLHAKEESEHFLKELRSFLHTAKTIVSDPLKEKIDKEFLKLNEEVAK